MANNTLLELLRFAALVAPAIAGLMQVLESEGVRGSFAFDLLELGLVSILIGGVILIARLVVVLDDNFAVIGSLFIFVSLLSAAAAIGWHSTSLSKKFAEATGSSPSIWTVGKQMVSLVFVLAIPAILISISLYMIDEALKSRLAVGPIRNIDSVTPTIMLGLVLFVTFIRIVVYLLRTGAIPVDDIGDSMVESTTISVVMLVILLVFTLPAFLPFYSLFYIPRSIVIVSKSHIVFLIPYLWTGLFPILLFASEFEQEKEGEMANS